MDKLRKRDPARLISISARKSKTSRPSLEDANKEIEAAKSRPDSQNGQDLESKLEEANKQLEDPSKQLEEVDRQLKAINDCLTHCSFLHDIADTGAKLDAVTKEPQAADTKANDPSLMSTVKDQEIKLDSARRDIIAQVKLAQRAKYSSHDRQR